MRTERIRLSAWTHRLGWTGLALVLLAWIGGCSSDSDSLSPPVDDPSPTPPSPLLVSDTVLGAAPAGASVTGANVAGSRELTAVVYVSLAEGEIPTGTSATIQNLRTGATVTTPMVAGGFDPVAVEAAAGDTLEIEVSSGPNRLSFLLRVPATAPPIVVRTEPADGKRDVPLNARIVIVFSEPIDGNTLSGTTIRLKRGFVEVAGEVQFADAGQLTAEFVPAEPLAPSTEYKVLITQEIEDLDGEPLEEPVSVEFTTTTAAALHLAFAVQPSNVLAGAVISPAVEVRVQDAQGSTVAAFSDSITVGLGQNPAGGSLAGTMRVAAVGGVATFPDLRLDVNGVGYRLAASAGGVPSDTSEAFSVTGGNLPGTRLVFTVQPSGAVEGSPISPAVEVTVQDALGNTVTDFADSITLALGEHTIDGVLAGTVRVPAFQGVAIFEDLWVIGGATGVTLVASAPGLTSVESVTFGVGREPPTDGLDSIRLRILDAETQAPLPSPAIPQMLAAPISDPTHLRRVPYYSDGSGLVGLLPAGTWTIAVSVMHGWSLIFPGLHLYSDTTLTVEVVEGEITVLPDLLLRPRAPLLLVGVNRCPWALPDPPTPDDWGNCDSGYWGGVDVRIEVNGVAGTSTDGVHFEATIGPAQYTEWATSWDDTPWSAHFDVTVPGEYDVRLVDVAPSISGATWELVPWQSATTRVRVGQGLSYVGFDFWYK